MNPNPILEEIRLTREEMLAKAGGTLAGLVAQLQQDERHSGRTVLAPTDLAANGHAHDRRSTVTSGVEDVKS